MSASVERDHPSSLPRRASAYTALAALCVVLAGGCGSPSAPGFSHDGPPSVAHTLRALVPRGEGFDVRDSGAVVNDPLAPVLLTYRGAGQVSASVGRLPLPVPPRLSQCPDTSEHPYSRCVLTRLGNGATLVLDKSPADEAHPDAGQRWTAVRTGRDGGQVVVSASSTSDGGGSSPRRPAPPLSDRQLAEIAVSDRWEPVLAAVPSPPPGSSPTRSFQYLPAATITEIVRGAVPGGLRTGDEGGAAGYGHLTVDDGRGRCLVAVTVQEWEPGDKAMEEIFRGAVREADGTRVRLAREHPRKGGEGALAWSVDIWRPDGLRVAVTELNTHAYRLPGVRRDPALPVDRLKEIALSGAWRAALSAEATVQP
ncbi:MULTISPECIES: hypothetical protein [unclassified Streptomyces]|uniref:hypothetical protein n=1 Tax=unclassified Streptomyces TaxID=2593676 RepID=UPI0016613501|nr:MULTISPECIES: hypothetical protein [unclassified Streptomyces]MBD0710931.1 hypothetical protein [Streptomyces sp. CBMA291]MBD0717350.1 hypothetical protein [Streptomyces sp. CBMA370]